MGTVVGGKKRSVLWLALQELSNRQGVRRPDLFDELHDSGVFNELRRSWNINLANGEKFASRQVWANLATHISFLEAAVGDKKVSPDKQRERYLVVVRASFNVAPPELAGKDLTARRRWLEKGLGLSTSTTQRYLNHAIDQIEQQIIAAGFQPVTTDTEASETSSDALGADEGETARPARDRRKTARRAVVASAIVATCTAGALIAWTLNGDGNTEHENKAGGSPSASVSKSASAAALSKSSVPFSVAHSYVPNQEQCDGWVFPGKQPSDMPAPPANGLTAAWAHSHGGIDADETRIKIVLQGATQADVELSNLRVVDLHKGKMPMGTEAALSTQCGGVIKDRVFQVALGAPTPQMKLVDDKGDGSVPSVGDVPPSFKTADDDPEVWIVEANGSLAIGKPNTSCGCSVAWKLAVNWSYKGQQGTLVIDDHGQPFHTGGSGTATLLDRNGSWVRLTSG